MQAAPQVTEVAVTQLTAENMVQLGQAGYDFYVQSLQNPQLLIFRQRAPGPIPALAPPEPDHQQDDESALDDDEIRATLRGGPGRPRRP